MFKVMRNDNVFAVTTDRDGGVSQGNYSSLNLAFHVKDNDRAVQRNYEILCDNLKIDYSDLYFPNQTHSDKMVEVKKGDLKIQEECDALYTKDKGVYIGVLTADCLPILMYAPDKNIVVAIHAGWQGSNKLIVEKCIDTLVEKEGIDTSKLEVMFAPSIHQKNYEITKEFKDNLLQHKHLDVESCFEENRTIMYFDNRRFNILQLLYKGVLLENIKQLNECTFENNYFSYRRDGITGRQLSLIGIK